jgi:hypothetical protein
MRRYVRVVVGLVVVSGFLVGCTSGRVAEEKSIAAIGTKPKE